jgi:hypothetical protein
MRKDTNIADELLQSMEQAIYPDKGDNAPAPVQASERLNPITRAFRRLRPNPKPSQSGPALEHPRRTKLASFVEDHRDILNIAEGSQINDPNRLADSLARLADEDPRKFCELLGKLLTIDEPAASRASE